MQSTPTQPFKRQSNLSSRNQPQKAVFLAPRPPVEDDLPQCLFHSQNRITKFCECKDCTLPLCQKCEQVHLEQHDKSKVKPLISSYASVRDRAVKDLPALLRRYRAFRDELARILQAQYQLIEQNIQSYFDTLTKQIDGMWISEQKLGELEVRCDNILKGSVKSLIQHYSDTYPEAKYPKLNINYSSTVLYTTLRGIISVAGTTGPLGEGKLKEYQEPAGNQGKRVDYAQKMQFTGKQFNMDDAALQQIQNGGERGAEYNKADTANSQNRNQIGRKQPEGIDTAAINRKKYQDFRDSYRRGGNFMLASTSTTNIPPPNRSNATSVQARDWKKHATAPPANPVNQSSTANILSVAGFQTSEQRSPSFSTNNTAANPNTKPSPMPKQKLPIKEVMGAADMTRNKSVEMKKIANQQNAQQLNTQQPSQQPQLQQNQGMSNTQPIQNPNPNSHTMPNMHKTTNQFSMKTQPSTGQTIPNFFFMKNPQKQKCQHINGIAQPVNQNPFTTINKRQTYPIKKIEPNPNLRHKQQPRQPQSTKQSPQPQPYRFMFGKTSDFDKH